MEAPQRIRGEYRWRGDISSATRPSEQVALRFPTFISERDFPHQRQSACGGETASGQRGQKPTSVMANGGLDADFIYSLRRRYNNAGYNGRCLEMFFAQMTPGVASLLRLLVTA